MASFETDPSDPQPVPVQSADDRFVNGEMLERVARAAGDGGASAEDYARERDAQRIPISLQALVRDNPIAALLIAAGVGFLIGRTFSRDDPARD